jgi:pimeloyl-ACP methyl ester carboxylesterase
LVDDAAASLVIAHQQFGDPLLVMGESLGAAVAALAVSRHRKLVASLMLITPWDKLENVASHHYPWLPVRWLLRDRYDSAAALAAWSDRPTVIAVAARDSIVPSRFGQALYEALPEGSKQLRLLEGAEHNDWLDHVDGDWWGQVTDYLLPAEHKR